MTVESIVARLSNRYGEAVLRSLITLPAVDQSIKDDLDTLDAWTQAFSAALPKSSGDRADKSNGGSYTAELDRGDGGGEGVRIAIRKMQHGVGATRYLPREFFDSNEYRHITDYASKTSDLIGEGAHVSRGEKDRAVETFSEVVEWLMAEARKGQSIQRYKGLGEMNPEQLWDTTVNPETRRLMQVRIEDAVKADEIFTTLMGDNVEPRREFIEKNALTVSNLDI
jgi:DNA gyrase subunit B